jgi:ribosomal protein S18 acetylase RimI-like enzyme
LSIRPIRETHRETIEQILVDTGVFKPAEVEVGLEVLDSYLDAPGFDYTAIGAFRGRTLLGYACYGATPLTLGTWDLYWIAVAPSAQGTGIGTMLLAEVETRLRDQGARLLIIETSSQPLYEPTRAFYERHNYRIDARITDFYAPGDDRVIFVKRLDTNTGTNQTENSRN